MCEALRLCLPGSETFLSEMSLFNLCSKTGGGGEIKDPNELS